MSPGSQDQDRAARELDTQPSGFMGCFTGPATAHRQGRKHRPGHGMTDLGMLCNKATRNLLSFLARKKLWL